MTGIILAGGNSSRFGEDKAFLRIEGKPLIEKIVIALETIFPEIIIVTNSPESYGHLGKKMVKDIIPGKGPLSGIHAGLVYSPSFYNFMVACDMPFVNEHLIRYMEGKLFDCDVLIPRVAGKIEPLHAFYSKNCIKPIENCLKSNNLKISGLINEVNTHYIEEGEILSFDPLLESFVNINTQKDYECYLTNMAVK